MLRRARHRPGGKGQSRRSLCGPVRLHLRLLLRSLFLFPHRIVLSLIPSANPSPFGAPAMGALPFLPVAPCGAGVSQFAPPVRGVRSAVGAWMPATAPLFARL